MIQENPELSGFISAADGVMEALGYTEHGFRHANLTGRIAFQVLSRLGYDARTSNLGCIAGYLHDVGNMVSREMHGQTGALLVYQSLKDEVAPEDLFTIVAAVANHEERHGVAVSPASAAVILADKSDVHRSRVRKADGLEFDIHDRVNYAAEQSFLRVNSEVRTITLELTIDTEISQVMEYFEIFLGRMQMCRLAAETLGATSAINSDKTGTLTLNQMTAVEMTLPGRRYVISDSRQPRTKATPGCCSGGCSEAG